MMQRGPDRRSTKTPARRHGVKKPDGDFDVNQDLQHSFLDIACHLIHSSSSLTEGATNEEFGSRRHNRRSSIVSRGVANMLTSADGIEVVGEGATAADTLEIAEELAPDVMLLDIRLAGGGIEAAASIARA